MTDMPSSRTAEWGRGLYLGLVLLLLLLPLLALLPMSLGDAPTITVTPVKWSLRWYHQILGDPEWRRALGWSLLTSSVASLIATTMGYLGAAALTRGEARFRSVLELLILSPMMVPAVVVALSTTLLANALGLTGSWIAIAIGQSLLGLPVAALVIAASLRGIDALLLRAAVSLGSRPAQTFAWVVLPMALHGIVSALALSFLIAFDEVLIAVFLTTPDLQTLPVRIYQAVQYELTPGIAVVSVLLIAVVCVGIVAGGLYQWTMRRIAPRAPASE